MMPLAQCCVTGDCESRAKSKLLPRAVNAMTACYLGASIACNEDRRLLLGRALFVNDVERPGMLHVALLRSPHAHASLGAVDLSWVRQRPGVVEVIAFSSGEPVF